MEDLPYSEAILEWFSAKKRRGIVKTKDSVGRTVLETDFPLQFQTNVIELMQCFWILKFESIHLHTPFTKCRGLERHNKINMRTKFSNS